MLPEFVVKSVKMKVMMVWIVSMIFGMALSSTTFSKSKIRLSTLNQLSKTTVSYAPSEIECSVECHRTFDCSGFDWSVGRKCSLFTGTVNTLKEETSLNQQYTEVYLKEKLSPNCPKDYTLSTPDVPNSKYKLLENVTQ